jgi:pilus assembly protein Flp/PilA
MKNFTRDTRGATAIEYGLIAALIAMVVITAVSSVGTTLSSTLYGAVATAVTASAP